MTMSYIPNTKKTAAALVQETAQRKADEKAKRAEIAAALHAEKLEQQREKAIAEEREREALQAQIIAEQKAQAAEVERIKAEKLKARFDPILDIILRAIRRVDDHVTSLERTIQRLPQWSEIEVLKNRINFLERQLSKPAPGSGDLKSVPADTPARRALVVLSHYHDAVLMLKEEGDDLDFGEPGDIVANTGDRKFVVSETELTASYVAGMLMDEIVPEPYMTKEWILDQLRAEFRHGEHGWRAIVPPDRAMQVERMKKNGSAKLN
jgi:hypothetical protein